MVSKDLRNGVGIKILCVMAFATTTQETSTVWNGRGEWCLPADDDSELWLVFLVLLISQFPERGIQLR